MSTIERHTIATRLELIIKYLNRLQQFESVSAGFHTIIQQKPPVYTPKCDRPHIGTVNVGWVEARNPTQKLHFRWVSLRQPNLPSDRTSQAIGKF